MNDGDPNSESSLVPHESRSLVTQSASQNRILAEMVASAFALTTISAVALDDLDSLVRNAERLFRSNGDGMTVENITAFGFFLRAAVAGHSKAQYFLRECYRSGNGAQKDSVKAVKWLKESANRGCIKAMIVLAIGHQHGTGLTPLVGHFITEVLRGG